MTLTHYQQEERMGQVAKNVRGDGKQLTLAPPYQESLISLAMPSFEADHMPIYPSVSLHQRFGPSFHPVESDVFKDLSLKDILDLSDDYVLDGSESKTVFTNGIPGGARSNSLLLADNAIPGLEVMPWKQIDTAEALSQVTNIIDGSSLATEEVLSLLEKEDPVEEPEAGLPRLVTSTEASRVTPCFTKSPKKRARAVCEEDEMDSVSPSRSHKTGDRFRPYQEEQWADHFKNLCVYREQVGNCLVPHHYPSNPALARWVKRQRYSYKLLIENKSSSMTRERIEKLEAIGFVWDSQGAAWEDRFRELTEFGMEHGHTNVPSSYTSNPKLATWVKCQRRQYKAYRSGRHSTMTKERITKLESIYFEWLVRPLHGNKLSLSNKKARTS